MTNEEFARETTLSLSVGHLLVLWDILSNRLEDTLLLEKLSDDEKRALWALQDMCEGSLIKNGVTGLPEPEWNSLVESAKAHMKTVRVEFLDDTSGGNGEPKGV